MDLGMLAGLLMIAVLGIAFAALGRLGARRSIGPMNPNDPMEEWRRNALLQEPPDPQDADADRDRAP